MFNVERRGLGEMENARHQALCITLYKSLGLPLPQVPHLGNEEVKIWDG